MLVLLLTKTEMKAYFSLFLILILAGCGAQKDTDPSTWVPLVNTTWRYSDSDHDRNYDLKFKSNKTLGISNGYSTTESKSAWKQDGLNVYFSYNDNYVIYKGKRKTQDLIEGTARNKVADPGSGNW